MMSVSGWVNKDLVIPEFSPNMSVMGVVYKGPFWLVSNSVH
jgi:hypothetical protein